MADPFSLLAGAAGLFDVAIRTSATLRALASELKNAPAIVLALSNEIADLQVVLSRIHEARQAIYELGGQQQAEFVSTLDSQIRGARAVLEELGTLSTKLQNASSSARRIKWVLMKNNAVGLKNQLKEQRQNINELLIAYDSTMSTRIKMELQNVRIGLERNFSTISQKLDEQLRASNSQSISTSDAVRQDQVSSPVIQTATSTVANLEYTARSNHPKIESQLSGLHGSIEMNTQMLVNVEGAHRRPLEGLEQILATILAEVSGPKHNVSPTRLKSAEVVASSHVFESSTIYFSLRPRSSHCLSSCICQCHTSGNSACYFRLPAAFEQILGRLFFSYTASPSLSASCNVQACAKTRYVRLQIVYSFPAWLLAYSIFSFLEISTSRSMRITISTGRRINPDIGSIIQLAASSAGIKNLQEAIDGGESSLRDVCFWDGRTALHIALDMMILSSSPGAFASSIDRVRVLLRNGADPDQEDDSGRTPRHIAAHSMLTIFQEQKNACQIDELLPLSACIDSLDLPLIHKVLSGICPISLSSILRNSKIGNPNTADNLFNTPLIYAAGRNDMAAINTLIRLGADVNFCPESTSSPLIVACEYGSAEAPKCVEALLAAGADPNYQNYRGFTALHFAKSVKVARLLIAAGAHVDVECNIKMTPLVQATYHNRYRVMRYLIDIGANIHPTVAHGHSLVFKAVYFSAHDCLRLLLRRDSTWTNMDGHTNTILHHTALFGDVETMGILAAHESISNVDVLARNNDGLTAAEVFGMRQLVTEDLRAAFKELLTAADSPGHNSTSESEREDAFQDAVEFI